MNANLPRRGLASAAVGVLALALAGGPAASAGTDAGPATIKMKLDGKRLFFAGPAEVSSGQRLEIRNATKPRKVGPHTFSLTERSVRPNTKQERKRCFSPGQICMDIAIAHKFNPRTERVNQQVVKAGKAGWDLEFTDRSKGDSWYTEQLGESFTQKVTAEPGTTLRFMCAVHVGMQGKIKVVE